MTKSELFKKAHKLAKATIKAGDDYRVTFGLCLKAVIADAKAPKTSTYIVEVTNGLGEWVNVEVQATSHRNAIEVYETANPRRKKVEYVSLKVIDVPTFDLPDNPEYLLQEMDFTGTDFVKLKGKRRPIIVTRQQCENALIAKNQSKRMSRRKVMA